MWLRNTAVLLIAAIVVTPMGCCPCGDEGTRRSAALVARFPALSGQPARYEPFIADPLLRPKGEDDADYERAINNLANAQYQFIKQAQGGAPDLTLLDGPRAELASANARRLEKGLPRGDAQCRILESNTVLILFRQMVSAEDIQTVLSRHQLVVRAGIPRINFVVAETPDWHKGTDEEEATRLAALVRSLTEETHFVEVAVESVGIGGTIIPKPDDGSRLVSWFAADNAHVNTHFTEAWNFHDTIGRRGSGPVKVGVLDSGFLAAHADLTLTLANAVQGVPPCGRNTRTHGTEVAGVIGAAWGDGTGVNGGAKYSELVACTPTPAPDFDNPLCRKEAAFEGYEYGLETLFAQSIPVVNASIGYNWSQINLDAMAQTDTGDKIRVLVTKQGVIARAQLGGPYADQVVVSAAGNDCGNPCTQLAMWSSPFNWAAANGAANVVVVEALNALGTDKLPMSNIGGTIRAIGANIPTTVFGSPPFDICPQSTSCATPMVTATVAMMLAVNPSLKASAITAKLGRSNLDAFQAVHASDPTADIDLANLDNDQSNQVNAADARKFLDAYRQVCTDTITDDLNEDTKKDRYPNEAKFCRIDLNGDQKIDRGDFNVMLRVWTGSQGEKRNAEDEFAALPCTH